MNRHRELFGEMDQEEGKGDQEEGKGDKGGWVG
jgi:hypothetical protein